MSKAVRSWVIVGKNRRGREEKELPSKIFNFKEGSWSGEGGENLQVGD